MSREDITLFKQEALRRQRRQPWEEEEGGSSETAPTDWLMMFYTVYTIALCPALYVCVCCVL